uniref:Uncharacterized protein n=1 Tax=Brassica oleracea var. oleracea TaxID=109376 RepID=A0A0D2ZQ57_BRAOL
MCKCRSHGTFPLFGLQSSHLNICYYHQDLHRRPLRPGSRPRFCSDRRALLLIEAWLLPRRPGIGRALQRHPFSGLVDSAILLTKNGPLGALDSMGWLNKAATPSFLSSNYPGETSREQATRCLVRLVFRPYTQVRRTICTSVSLRASTRVSSGFAPLRHSSPSFGSRQACSHSNPSQKIKVCWLCAHTRTLLRRSRSVGCAPVRDPANQLPYALRVYSPVDSHTCQTPWSVFQDGSNGEPTCRRPEHADAKARREVRAADHD